ncbi:hypothetical protein HQN86_16430 [Pedobacter panaciterrae]|uniref:hypothetical protein n=1 Tax=Pedobacter panaciterrae TaxID=363849 RepID=UPI00155DDAB2|nr:hypothetical protein [Pedobacter panaciterrae]NQX55210.1 hypothetical protein [Pedobacter panaciterrae]
MEKYRNHSTSKTILIYNSVGYFVPLFFKEGIPAYPVYKQIPFFLKVIRKILIKLNVSKSLWFDEWKGNLSDIETVIFFSTNPFEAVEYIKEKKANVRIIFWYWNPVFRGIKPAEIPDDLCEKWSFDKNDCMHYGMKYNTTFYFNSIKLPFAAAVYDIVFVGVDKGRRSALNKINENISISGANTHFYIVDDSWSKRTYNGAFPPISYPNYLELVSKSKAILDYVQEGQEGLTLRVMESIFFNKKLITNDRTIILNDFYNADNIFILDVDNIQNLSTFLNTPYQPINPEIVERYNFVNWLRRFFIQ